MDNNVMTPDVFFKRLKLDPKQRHAFVLGHGINYYLRNNVASWKELMDKFISGHLKDLEFISAAKDISNTEAANLIEFFADEEFGKCKQAAEMREKLMRFLDDCLNAAGPHKCTMLNAAWENHHILTTNFDDNIEKYIRDSHSNVKLDCHEVIVADETKRKIRNNKYLWNRFWGLEDCSADCDLLSHHHAIWHIHGKLGYNSSQSVLFSLTRYVNAIKQVELWDLASKSDWAGRHTWVNIFYNAPLIIAGLGLTNQEVFLRTLLIERKRHWKKLIKDKKQNKEPQSYYLVRKHSESTKESNGREFLRALGFEVVEFDDADDMYNNKNWDVNSK